MVPPNPGPRRGLPDLARTYSCGSRSSRSSSVLQDRDDQREDAENQPYGGGDPTRGVGLREPPTLHAEHDGADARGNGHTGRDRDRDIWPSVPPNKDIPPMPRAVTNAKVPRMSDVTAGPFDRSPACGSSCRSSETIPRASMTPPA
jgi:hypothetical protein